ncbi:hypothetical protein [Argonema galeatum]|uniref:hypothetical protein n=1 Tax=Argonema galeatum TaxID=2942762 RepID=UPI0020125670|nr:hypothetical protein [Argonema galeatum]MCL1466865.1 hypothetical protein [Argonema galeatum A003/A1]
MNKRCGSHRQLRYSGNKNNDQFAWGRWVYELGVGAKPIPRKKLNSQKLSEAIAYALTKEVQQQAKILGEKIQNENGVDGAVKAIASCLQQR